MPALPPLLPRLGPAVLLLALATPAAAETLRYELDPVHTRVLFAVSHAGFSQALGTVSGSTGVLEFDADDWSRARLDATVPLARLDLGDPQWNAAVLASRLLDAADHPEARFVSTLVTPRDAQHAQVCGDFTLRGVTAPLCMEVTLNALKRHPMPPFRRTVGFSATATLSRSAFGIDAWKTVIGDTVELRIEAEAIRRSAGAEAAVDDADKAGADEGQDPPVPDAPASAIPTEPPLRP
jgi:polyisoprenoid-binding protein YceI